MTVQVMHVPAYGVPTPIDLKGDLLEGLQRLVGGCVEVAARRGDFVLLVNEEGLYTQEVVVNQYASTFAGTTIVGDAVLIAEGDFQ